MSNPCKKETSEAGGMSGSGAARGPSLYDAIRTASNVRTTRMQSQGQNPSAELARDIGKKSMYYKGAK